MEHCVYYDPGITESSGGYLCNSSKSYRMNGDNVAVPLHETMYSFAPAIMMAELMLTNVMMLSVLIAIFRLLTLTYLLALTYCTPSTG